MADIQELSPADWDDRPIAQRRKRRASAANLQPSPIKVEGQHDSSTAASPQTVPQTPVRKKRVRFSFPPDNSTGLTQRVARTRLMDVNSLDGTRPQFLRQNPKRPRRAASVGPTDLTQLSSNNIEMQFKPIRQILSARTQRRVMRHHMGEAINEIEAEEKSHGAVCKQLALVKQELEELTTGQLEETSASTRCRNLEAEIDSLKQQLGRQQDNLPDDSIITDSDTVDLIASDDLNDSPVSRQSPDLGATRHNSGAPTPTSPHSPLSLYAPNTASGTPSPTTSKGVQVTLPHSPLEVVDDGVPNAAFCAYKEEGVQTTMMMIDVEEVQQHLQRQALLLKVMRLKLENLVPGETSLPLASSTTSTHGEIEAQDLPLVDAGPLLDEFGKHLHRTIAELNKASNAVAVSQQSYSVLRGNFDTALSDLDEARSAYAQLLAWTQRRGPSTEPESRDAMQQSSARSDSSQSGESDSPVRLAPGNDNNPPKAHEEVKRMFKDVEQRVKELEEESCFYEKARTSLISAL